MWPFSDSKVLAVKKRILELINMPVVGEPSTTRGSRLDNRINRVLIGMVIPIENRRPRIDGVFTAVSKDFSTSGVALILNQTCELDQVILGFRINGDMTFFRAESRHTAPMEGGYYQTGFQLFEVVSPLDYPELESLSL